MEEKKYEIVSLGCYCLSRTILTRQHLKPSKAQGELSCPFDLVIHFADRITHYISNDFDGYFDDLYFEQYKRYWFDFRKKGIWKKLDGTEFFHDKDCRLNDREKLVQRISKRIDNFRKIIKDEKPIIFVQALKKEEDIENLYSALKVLRGSKPFKLIIIDLLDTVKKEYETVSVLKIPFPSEEYEKYWDREKYYQSEEGKLFEKTVTQKVKAEIEDFMQN
ncbi:MAG: DUF1796 family putative cysteine peptidase [Candidatus Avigastranaerophilus sp.]